MEKGLQAGRCAPEQPCHNATEGEDSLSPGAGAGARAASTVPPQTPSRLPGLAGEEELPQSS